MTIETITETCVEYCNDCPYFHEIMDYSVADDLFNHPNYILYCKHKDADNSGTGMEKENIPEKGMTYIGCQFLSFPERVIPDWCPFRKQESNFEQFHKYIKTFEKNILKYRDDPFYYGMKPFREGKTELENGIYLTIRAGMSGIYTMLNEYKEGHWQCAVLDGSKTIAYRPLTGEESDKYQSFIEKEKRQ